MLVIPVFNSSSSDASIFLSQYSMDGMFLSFILRKWQELEGYELFLVYKFSQTFPAS